MSDKSSSDKANSNVSLYSWMVFELAKFGSLAVAVTPSPTIPGVAFVDCAGMMCFHDSVVTRVKANWPSKLMSSRRATMSRLTVVGTVKPPLLLVPSVMVLNATAEALRRMRMESSVAVPRIRLL